MANLYLEIGRLPPVNFPLLVRVNGGPAAGGMWQVQAFFHPEGRTEGFPGGYLGAFGITADELPTAVVTAMGIASSYGYAVSWVTLPGETLAARFPSLAAMATAPTPQEAVQGTTIAQPAPATPEALQSFLARVVALASTRAVPPAVAPVPPAAPAAPVAAPAPLPAPAEAPSTPEPVAPVSVSETPNPVKTKKKSAKGKSKPKAVKKAAAS